MAWGFISTSNVSPVKGTSSSNPAAVPAPRPRVALALSGPQIHGVVHGVVAPGAVVASTPRRRYADATADRPPRRRRGAGRVRPDGAGRLRAPAHQGRTA